MSKTTSPTKSVDSGCCQMPLGDRGVCGEATSLEITNEFRRLYEEKLLEIENNGAGDCVQEKLRLQSEWIEDLTEQNDMLVKAVSELEHEATERVQLLEDKLQKSATCISEVMKKYLEHDVTNEVLKAPYEKIYALENNQKSLVELIRRFQEQGQWVFSGLDLEGISLDDLGLISNFNEIQEKHQTLQNHAMEEGKVKDRNLNKVDSITSQLNIKKEECEELKQNLFDVRQALTEEVATQHDLIRSLKQDYGQLEERCQIAEKQGVLKEDIIKELRKEIKSLKQKQESNDEEVQKLTNKIEELEQSLSSKNETIQRVKEELEKVGKRDVSPSGPNKVCRICKGRSKVTFADCPKEHEDAAKNVEEFKQKILDLEEALKHAQNRASNLQNAVDLYSNTINVMEATQEKSKIEVEQQKMTIKNLQEALVGVKQELDDLRLRTEETIRSLSQMLVEDLDVIKDQFFGLFEFNKHLEQINFNLELDYCEQVRDYEILNKQMDKYKILVKNLQVSNSSMSQEYSLLENQKLAYEDAVLYFKNEMKLLTKQLCEVQDFLKLSHDSSSDQNLLLKESLGNLEIINEKLQENWESSEKSKEIEQKMLLDHIKQLEQEIQFKNVNLSKYSDLLEIAQNQNQSLRKEIEHLHLTMQQFESANSKTKENTKNVCTKIDSCQSKFEDLQKALNVKTKELNELKVKLQKQEVKSKDREKEIVHYQIVLEELRNTLLELNSKFVETTSNYDTSSCDDLLNTLKKSITNLQVSELLKEEELANLKNEFQQKLLLSQQQENCYKKQANQFEKELIKIRDELQSKTLQLDSTKKSVEFEVNNLKTDLNRLLRKHCELDQENNRLYAESEGMKASYEENNQLLKEQLEEYLVELQQIQIEKEDLVRRNGELLAELRSMSKKNDSTRKSSESERQSLVSELGTLRQNYFEICTESRNVMAYVKAWLAEEHKIHDSCQKNHENKQSSCGQSNKEKVESSSQGPARKFKVVLGPQVKYPVAPLSLGSQGTAPSESGDESCDLHFMNESDEFSDDYDEHYINSVKQLTFELRNKNELFKSKPNHCECLVSKDN